MVMTPKPNNMPKRFALANNNVGNSLPNTGYGGYGGYGEGRGNNRGGGRNGGNGGCG